MPAFGGLLLDVGSDICAGRSIEALCDALKLRIF